MADAPPPPAGPARTLATLGLISALAPANLALTLAALGRRALTPGTGSPPAAPPAAPPRTILLSGGKMTKALHLARAFDRAGHRVILVEAAKYRLTGHRFSRAVDRFYTVPPSGDPAYGPTLAKIIRREHVDVYVPVCSPASARDDARVFAELSALCEVIHFDPETLQSLDDKAAFARSAAELGLPVPDAHRITDPAQVLEFDFGRDDRDPPYILKSIAYDPVRRLDLTLLPGPEAAARTFVESLPIGPENPWVMQSFVTGREYCTHSTVRGGRVQLHCCCESSAFQLNYAMVQVPEIEDWVRRYAAARGLTGQLSLDFICGDDGRCAAIECNPRTHSAITMFYDHPDVARAYLEDGVATVTPTPESRPTYWLYHELWRALRDPRRARGPLQRIRHGKEAIFSWEDPLPFLLVHHLQIPALLLSGLRHRRPWLKIDFNIGKLVEPGGD